MILTITANPTVDRVYFVDKFEMGEVHRPERMVYSAGGKGLNVARVAHIIGEEASAMGFVGGFNGEYIKSELQKIGIKTDFTQVDGETRVCVNISDSKGLSGEILEKGPVVTQKQVEEFLKAFGNCVDNYNIVCASGSLPQGVDSSFYCEIIRVSRAHNKRVIVDASGKVLEDVIEAKPFMIKPNRYELSLLMKKEISSLEDVKEALIFLHKKGIALPLITLGGDGAMAYIDGEFYKFNSPKVVVKNTVGSGDSTVAGIATGLRRGMSVIDSIKLGMACGTANTQFEETGIVSQELVEKYYKEVTVEKL